MCLGQKTANATLKMLFGKVPRYKNYGSLVDSKKYIHISMVTYIVLFIRCFIPDFTVLEIVKADLISILKIGAALNKYGICPDI